MYRVLIIDDEKFVRKSIINRINWKKLGLDVVGEADSGQAAWDMLDLVKPDIVLVDIKMPLMSGIELIRKSREQLQNIQFIILSGYDDFEYTKEAIKLGVANYIKKPIDEKELEETLLLIINSFQHKQKNENILKELTRQVESSSAELQEGYLNELVSEGSQYSKINLDFPYPFFTMLLAHAPEIESMNLMLAQLRDQISCIEEQYNLGQSPDKVKIFVFRNPEYIPEIRILANHTFPEPYKLHQLAESIRQTLINLNKKSARNYFIDTAISSSSDRVEDIPLSYREALHILKHKIFGSPHPIMDKSVIKQTDSTFTDYTYNLLTSLRHAMEYRNLSELDKTLSKLLSGKNNQEKFSVYLLESVILELSNILKKFSLKFGNDTPEQLYIRLYKPFFLLQFDSINALRDNLSGLLYSFFNDSAQMQEEHIVKRIQQFININYANDLSLQQISEEFYLNPSYLSQLFKSKTNENLSKYIEDTRIEKAKELLAKLKLSVVDVAFQVGYNNANYFSKVFKKKVGISPSHFQEELIKKSNN